MIPTPSTQRRKDCLGIMVNFENFFNELLEFADIATLNGFSDELELYLLPDDYRHLCSHVDNFRRLYEPRSMRVNRIIGKYGSFNVHIDI